MRKLIVLALLATLTACNSVTVRMTPAEQDRFLFHGAYGTYELARLPEPTHFRQATATDHGFGAGE